MINKVVSGWIPVKLLQLTYVLAVSRAQVNLRSTTAWVSQYHHYIWASPIENRDCTSLVWVRFGGSSDESRKRLTSYLAKLNHENPEDYVRIPYQTLVLRLSLMCCSLRVLSSRRRSVSSVLPPSQSGRLWWPYVLAMRFPAYNNQKDARLPQELERLKAHAAKTGSGYILMELRSTMVSRDKALAICYK